MAENSPNDQRLAPSQATVAAAAFDRRAKRMDIVVGLLFFILLSIVSSLLFLSDATKLLFDNLQQTEEVVRDYGTLTIAYDQALTTYEPTVSDTVSRNYMVNVYEGLTRFDRNFNIQPALALSWGMLDDFTWQFKLRPNVIFHDGSTFDAEDVAESIERAQTHEDSEMTGLLASIEEVKVIDELTVHIVTQKPDPTLLNKFTAVPMVPSDLTDKVIAPIGTGPYLFSHKENDDRWSFLRNEDYWGELPAFPELELRWIPDKFARYNAFIAGDVDVLAQVPPIFVDPLLNEDYRIASQPSLEVNFLLFGWEDIDSVFRHRELREAIAYVLDSEEVSRLASDFAHPINQYVSRGVFGYNADIPSKEVDIPYAQQLVKPLGNDLQVSLDLPEGLESFGDYVEDQLARIQVDVKVNIHTPEAYAKLVSSGESEFYFFGWRSELGDAGNFFNNVVHSSTRDGEYGEFNQDRYSNDDIDALIEQIDRNVIESERLEQLQELMATVVNDEIIGIPLFETDVLVALQPDLKWEPRVDNLILAADFK